MITVDIGDGYATFAVNPDHGKPVTFVVSDRQVNVTRGRSYYRPARNASRFVVGLKGSDGNGFSDHTTFEAACASALRRANRYAKAYSVARHEPRTVSRLVAA